MVLYGNNELSIQMTESTEETLRAEVTSQVNGKSFNIAWYFINYGSDVYDWVYVTPNASLIVKLTGIDDNNNLTWETLKSSTVLLISGASFNDNYSEISFGTVSSTEASELAKALESKKFNVTGLFLNYGADSYDWIYLNFSGTVVAKLTGLDRSTGYMTWLMLESGGADAFSSISVGVDNSVLFGD